MNSQSEALTSALGLFENLTQDELREMIQNDDKFDSIISDFTSKMNHDVDDEKQRLLEENKSLAEENLSHEPELVDLKEKIKELAQNAHDMNEVVKEKLEELKSKSGSMDVDQAFNLLQQAAQEMEEESEKTAEKFLNKDLDADDFLDQFLVQRKSMHMRKVKVDKMKELMSRKSLSATPYPVLDNYVNIPPVRPPPLVQGNFYPPPPIPYPIGPMFNMPLPNYNPNHY